MITPPFLESGDEIVIVAPASKVSAEVIEIAVNELRNWGLTVGLGKHLLSTRHYYFSGSDAERLADLQAALDNQDKKAVLCARGGYGTTRIADRINLTLFEKHPKWIVGFSDITTLHLALHKRGFETLHGMMPSQFADQHIETSLRSLRDALFEGTSLIEGPATHHNVQGTATGQVVGGNLSILVDSIGTPTELETDGKILIVEEIDEYKYRIDRMLTHLKRAGKLHRLSGLVVGYMTRTKDTTIPFGESVEAIFKHHVGEYGYPVSFGFPIGHEHPNLAWRHGSTMKLTVSSTGAALEPNLA
jgi:muramoyltetrapeptide carboxypeptidase